jgi:LysM repeat protein
MSNLKTSTFEGLQHFNDHIGRPGTTVSSVLDYAKASGPDATMGDKVAAGVTGVLSALDLATSFVKSLPGGAGLTLAVGQLSNEMAKLVLEATNGTGDLSDIKFEKVRREQWANVASSLLKVTGKAAQLTPTPQTKLGGILLDYMSTAIGFGVTAKTAVDMATGDSVTQATKDTIGKLLTAKQEAQAVSQYALVIDGVNPGSFAATSGNTFLDGNSLGLSAGDFSLLLTTQKGATTAIQKSKDVVSSIGSVYTIQSGDTLSGIAVKTGIPMKVLLANNPDITNPDQIVSGRTISLYTKVMNGNQSNAPSGLTIGNNQFYISEGFTDLEVLSFSTGFSVDAILAANRGLSIGGPLTIGATVNLPSPTNSISVSTNITGTATGSKPTDITSSINGDNSTLSLTLDYTLGSLLGNVNTSTGLQAVANDLISDGLRPGNFNLTLGLPTDFFTSTYTAGLLDSLTGSLFNTGANSLSTWTPTDPLVLDLNGDGVRLTNFTDAPVLFDADNDGGSKEQTGWVSAQDGIVVHDLNGDGQINNISETLSEYYKGVAGSNGVAGTKPYANGFKALQDLDTGNGTVGSAGYKDGIFDSNDAAWANLRVWVDANHDGKSWIDTNNNGIKEATETTTELKTFAELGITQINLASTTQSGEVRDGNEVLARGTFVQNGLSREAVAANFLNNPSGSTITQGSSGITASLDGSATKTYVSSNAVSTVNESLNATTLGVQNITGGAGNDALTGDAQANWLAGGLGADVFNAGAGDDVILVDAEDLANAAAINGGDGLDMVQVIGSKGVNLNMAASNVEIAVGNMGNDVIIGGGGTSVFVRGGDGDDVIVGSAANDALSGEDGDDYIDGGDGTDVAQYSGSYADYRVTKLNDTTWRVVDTKSGRDGADVMTNVEKLSFSDVSRQRWQDSARFRFTPKKA